ncbi:MAG: response regulator [Anaerolineae bacterium]|nr:response regulator [Anaerolineae bacterium]
MHSHSRKHILVVDDQEQILSYVKKIFDRSKTDYRIATAPNGFVAIGLLMQQRFDLVLTDWHMADYGWLGVGRNYPHNAAGYANSVDDRQPSIEP